MKPSPCLSYQARAAAGIGLLLISALCLPTQANAQSPKQAAIVIDDFGNDQAGTEQMMELSVPFTAAVMPFLPTTKRDAEWAHRLGHDVIIHLPMEPKRGKKSWLGPGAITTDLSDEQVREKVNAAIDDVPYAVGMNNHMGSRVTADERVMRIILEVCKQRGLFFLDSRTTDKSVVNRLAAEIGVPTAENHLFFDDVYTTRHISKQMRLFMKHLDEHDMCIAIGHVGPPGPKTAAVLRQSAEEVGNKAVIVPLTKLIPASTPPPVNAP